MCRTFFVFIMFNKYEIKVWKCENSCVEIVEHYGRRKRAKNTKEQGYVRNGHEKCAKNSSTQSSSASLMFHLHTRMQNQVLEPMG